MKNGDITPEGFMICFISDYFYDLLEKDMRKIMWSPGRPADAYSRFVSLRDHKAMIEFHRLEKKI